MSIIEERILMIRDLMLDVERKMLEELAPYVYVVGSYARGTQTDESDIDLYIRWIDRQCDDCKNDCTECEEIYTKQVIAIFAKYGINWDSCFPASLASINLPIMLDMSAYFEVDRENLQPFDVEVLGIPMKAVLDTYVKDKK